MSGEGIPILSVTLDLQMDPRLTLAGHNACMREANRAAMELHHRRHIPWHFMSFAGAKYSYQPRNKKYNARKLKQVGHTLPNVYSGASRQAARATHNVTATPKGAKLTFQLAIKGGITGRAKDAAAAARLFAAGLRKTAGFTQRETDGQKKLLMRIAEMQAIAPDEEKTLANEVLDVYVQQSNLPTARYRKRFKTA